MRHRLASAALLGGAMLLLTVGTTTRDAVTRPAAAVTVADPRALPHADSVADAARWAGVPQAAAVAGVTVNPGAWCGDFRSTDDTADEVATSGPKFHVVVAVPHDVAVQTAYQLYGRQQLADDAMRTVKTLEAFHRARTGISTVGQAPYGWTLKFDYGTVCGAQFPDISFYELPRTQAGYGSSSPDVFFNLSDDLVASGRYGAANKRYLVHYVGRNAAACGESYIYDPADSGGGNRYSMIYNFLTLGTTQGGGVVPVPDCGWTTDAHELGHSIGAATGGPKNNDGAHTWDCYNDTMSYAAVTAVCGDGAMYFDYGHDNYLMHGGGWYDTRYSAYWCKTVTGC